MIRDDILEWALVGVLGSIALLVVMLVEGTVFEAGVKHGKNAAEAERRERVEWACWCDQWADTRAAQERYLRERSAR